MSHRAFRGQLGTLAPLLILAAVPLAAVWIRIVMIAELFLQASEIPECF